MKHSKIFLGATTCLLAVAGVAATKAAKFGHTFSTYYTQVSVIGARCVVAMSNQPCTITPAALPRCFYYTVGPLHKVTTFPLYTGVNSSTPCINALKYLAN